MNKTPKPKKSPPDNKERRPGGPPPQTGEHEPKRLNQNTTPQRFLSATEAATHLNITRDALYKRTPPPPDAIIGTTRGWTKETLNNWNKTIPPRGGPR